MHLAELFLQHQFPDDMAANEKNNPDQTEKELKHLIEKAHSENSALNKILKLFSNPDDHTSIPKPLKDVRKKPNNEEQNQ